MPLTLDQLDRLSLSPADALTLRQLGEYRGRQHLFSRQRPEVLEALRTVAKVESTESSNRLEGVLVKKARLEALVLENTRPRDRSEQEIAGYRDALNLLHESAQHMPFEVNVILQLYRMVYGYLPQPGGHWKSADNQIIERAPDGSIFRVRFEAVPAVSTPSYMDQLTSRYARELSAMAHDPLTLVPSAILDFLCIHPFNDGNGRVARLLTLQQLYRSGYEVARYISLERCFEQSSQSYYETLEASSKDWHEGLHDPLPWIRYFWGVLLKAYGEFEERVGTISKGKGSKTEQVRAVVGRKVAPFSISELVRDCPGVSKEMIRTVLRAMRDEGLIEVSGRGRGAKWRKTGSKE